MNKVLSKSLPILVTGALLTPLAAQAVPSFARQTGMSCAMCHTVFPQLTPYGRMFKLQGYTTAAGMFAEPNEQSKNLSEVTSAPLAAMIQVSYGTQKNPGGNTPKDNAAFPDQFSLFYAGRISDHMGAFVQATLDSTGSFGMDNADIRAANSTTTADGKQVIYGVSLNNAPSVTDIVNTTPVWAAVPSASPDAVSGGNPAPGPVLLGSDNVNQQTMGIVGYAMYDNTWYGAVGAYHNTTALSAPGTAGPKGWAPYLRAVYQKDNGTNNYDIGAIMMTGDATTDTSNTSLPTSAVSDLGVDGQHGRRVGQ